MTRMRSLLISILFLSSTRTLLADATPPPEEKTKLETENVLEEIGPDKAPELREVPLKTENFIEFRPTFTPLTGKFHTENAFELSFKLDENTKVSYVQYFNTNLYNPSEKKLIFRQFGFAWGDAYARIKFNNVWESADKNTSVDIQERLYLPTAAAGETYPSRIDQGMITTSRTYLTVHHEFFPFLEMSLGYAPSIFIFRRSGYAAGAKEVANPAFEHLIEQRTNFEIMNNILITIPIVFRANKNRDHFDDSALSDRWGYILSTVPEIDWDINARHTIGAVYVSGNLLKADASGTNWKTGFTKGLIQLLWNIKF